MRSLRQHNLKKMHEIVRLNRKYAFIAKIFKTIKFLLNNFKLLKQNWFRFIQNFMKHIYLQSTFQCSN